MQEIAVANLYDYLSWRGDLSLAQDPFNEVDYLILSWLAYVPWEGIVSAPGEMQALSLSDAAAEFFASHPEAGKAEDIHSINVAVSAPETGLAETDIALISDIVASQTDYALSDIFIIEVK